MDVNRPLRYSIPGSIGVLTFASVLTLVFRTWEESTLAAIKGVDEELAAAILAIVVTFPLGFLFYESYYHRYEPFTFRGRYVRPDYGSALLRLLSASQRRLLAARLGRQLDVEPMHVAAPGWFARKFRGSVLDPGASTTFQPSDDTDAAAAGEPFATVVGYSRDDLRSRLREEGTAHRDHDGTWADKRRRDLCGCDQHRRQQRYRTRWFTNWDIARALLMAASDEGTDIKHEYRRFAEEYHALGASRTALGVGWLTASGYLVAFHRSEMADRIPEAPLAWAVATAISAYAFWFIHRSRGKRWESAIRRVGLSLRLYLERHPEVITNLPPSPPPPSRVDIRDEGPGSAPANQPALP